jgi:enterochelin esterase-like enzyme/drug/metabolite transporter (DMT)-like permease
VGVVVLALAVTAIGGWGVYRYWESYYQHRGFEPVAYLKHARRGRLETVHFYSTALHRKADYVVYLPPGYGRVPRRYPVYYLLHGSPGRPQVFIDIANMPVRMDNLISEHRMRPLILVFPDGRIHGSTQSDSEWANTPSGRYQSFVLNVVGNVDRRFATIANRGARVIAGFSAGAYGATNIALHDLRVFGSLQSWSGYYLETRSGVFARAGAATLDANSPLLYVHRLRRALARYPFRAYLFVGRRDDISPQTRPMARALAASGADVSYALFPGGHDWQLWHAHLNQLLVAASRDTSTPLPHARGVARRRRGARRRRHRRRRPGDRRLAALATLEPHHWHRGRISTLALVGGLLLALGSAAMINIGFLIQHRGLSRRSAEGIVPMLREAARNPTWLGGQLLGWIGFLAQIVAVAIAPLSLVQTFAAGGLALSVPLASRVFGQRVTRRQLLAVLAVAVGLAVLTIGFSTARDSLRPGSLVLVMTVAIGVAVLLSRQRAVWLKAVAAGFFYGVADAAIKATSVHWRLHGIAALTSGWTAVAVLGTFCGFLAFQSALATEGPVGAISLMNALAALVALGCGLLAFGESLGIGSGAVITHVIGISLVLACLPGLAAAQTALAEPRSRGPAAGPPETDPGLGYGGSGPP